MKRLEWWCLLGWLMLLATPAYAGDTVYYYYTTPLHSAVAVTNAQGQVIEQTYYAPYGKVLNRSLRDGPGYTGVEEDPATGLDYMQQRYYDPQAARFLSTDPVLPTDDGVNFNRYWYAKDNPYRYTDPDGRAFVIDDLAGIFLGAIINTSVVTIHAELSGQPITRGELAGAAVSGAIEGEGLVNAPETGGLTAAIAYGGGAAFAGDVTKQLVDKPISDFNKKELLGATALGGTIGLVTHGMADTPIPGLSSGRNSMRAVASAVRTRIFHGNATRMSTKTAVKAAIGSQAANASRTAAGDTIRTNLRQGTPPPPCTGKPGC